MFTNERLFTIQAFTITRVHCICNQLLTLIQVDFGHTVVLDSDHQGYFDIQLCSIWLGLIECYLQQGNQINSI